MMFPGLAGAAAMVGAKERGKKGWRTMGMPLGGLGAAGIGVGLAGALSKRRKSKRSDPLSPMRFHTTYNPDLGE